MTETAAASRAFISTPSASTSSASAAAPARAPSDSLAEFQTYEDYLDSQIQPDDIKYIENEEIMRALVELGYRGSQDTLKRDEFEARKLALSSSASAHPSSQPKLLAHTLSSRPLHLLPPFLHALATREDALRTGKLSSIAFLRHLNSRGQEVSAYVDLAERLKSAQPEELIAVFDGRRKLSVRQSDLSFYNWDTGVCLNTHSSNFQVKVEDDEAAPSAPLPAAGAGQADGGGGSGSQWMDSVPLALLRGGGLHFKNKRDRKVVSVDPDPRMGCGDNSRRVVIKTKEYIQCVIYDHMTTQQRVMQRQHKH